MRVRRPLWNGSGPSVMLERGWGGCLVSCFWCGPGCSSTTVWAVWFFIESSRGYLAEALWGCVSAEGGGGGRVLGSIHLLCFLSARFFLLALPVVPRVGGVQRVRT